MKLSVIVVSALVPLGASFSLAQTAEPERPRERPDMPVVATPVAARMQGDSSTARPDSHLQRGRRIVDENGDGIDDHLQTKGKGMNRGKDRFIDRDGDGICDGRESGLGVRAGRNTGGGNTAGGKWRGGRK